MFRKDTGLYHFFWQCADTIEGIGSIQWCHMVSKDYVSWKRLPKVLSPGSFSGGATQLADGSVKVLYKDMGKGHKFFTAMPANLSDPNLTVWEEARAPTAINGSTDPSSGFPQIGGGFGAVVGALGSSSTRGAFSLWTSDASFGKFTYANRKLFEFAWDRTGAFQSPVPRDPNFFRLPMPAASQTELREGDDDEQASPIQMEQYMWAVEGAMKMCYWAGHDFYVLGSYDEHVQAFTPQADQHARSFGSDPYDFGGSMFASQAFVGHDGTTIMSAWVLEGDCFISHWPPTSCNRTLARGWMGVHSLPRTVTIEATPPLPGARGQRYALVFAPLPALQTLHKGISVSRIYNITDGVALPLSPTFRSDAYEANLSFAMPTNTNGSSWDIGVQVLDSGPEFARAGIRSAAWIPVFIRHLIHSSPHSPFLTSQTPQPPPSFILHRFYPPF
jgi:sucrose-6-phosphate hydrolase SacC (GH32 family)